MSIEGSQVQNRSDSLPAPVGGLNYVSSIAAMPATDALVAENVVCYPDRVEQRYGAEDHVTGIVGDVKGLWDYNGTLATLWATTDTGVYNVSTSGVVGAAAIALTNGRTVACSINTGASLFLSIANGTDSLVQYDGTTWSSVAAFGGLNTNLISSLEVYRQRMFMGEKGTLTLWYLPANSIAGAATSYPLGAIFRRGGHIQSMGTWTIDGGNGPDDYLAVITSIGEIAVFAGSDPSSPSTWELKGVYYFGKPIGAQCLLKYEGDLLVLCEGGLIPLSKGLLSASVDRQAAVTTKIRQFFSDLYTLYGATEGWQMIAHPSVPFLLVNVPGTTAGAQLIMHASTGSWSTFSGWEAICWARFNGELYYGATEKVVHAWTGPSDFGNNIVSTILQAYSRWKYPRKKRTVAIRPTFQSTGAFTYTLGVANDFNQVPYTNVIVGSTTAALWGTGVWGTAVWAASSFLTRDWRVVPDVPGNFKAFYYQISSKTARAGLLATDFLYIPGGTF